MGLALFDLFESHLLAPGLYNGDAHLLHVVGISQPHYCYTSVRTDLHNYRPTDQEHPLLPMETQKHIAQHSSCTKEIHISKPMRPNHAY